MKVAMVVCFGWPATRCRLSMLRLEWPWRQVHCTGPHVVVCVHDAQRRLEWELDSLPARDSRAWSVSAHTHTPRGLVLAGCVLARVSRAARRGEGTASEIDRKGNHRGQPRIKFGLAEGMLAWWRVTAGTSPAIGAAAPQQHRLGGWAGTRQQRCEGMEAGPQQHAMHAAGAQV